MSPVVRKLDVGVVIMVTSAFLASMATAIAPLYFIQIGMYPGACMSGFLSGALLGTLVWEISQGIKKSGFRTWFLETFTNPVEHNRRRAP